MPQLNNLSLFYDPLKKFSPSNLTNHGKVKMFFLFIFLVSPFVNSVLAQVNSKKGSREYCDPTVFNSPSMRQAPSKRSVAHNTTIFNTDFVSAGVGGMRNVGSGSINISGISGTVTRAFLYWSGVTNSTTDVGNNILVNGTQVNGVNLGVSDNNCWGYHNSQAYKADVTAIVRTVVNGKYDLSGFGSLNPNGASLVVFFNDGNSNNNRDVVIFEGNDSNIPFAGISGNPNAPADPEGWNVLLSGINYSSGQANIQMHVGDGQAFDDDAIRINSVVLVPRGAIFNGNSVPGENQISGNQGNLWDIKTYDVTSFLTPGNNTLNLTTGVASDCLGLVAAIIDLPAGAAPPLPNTVFYSKPSGNLHVLASWGVNPDGSGEIPADFGEGKTFNLANRSGVYTMTGNWTVLGTLVNPSGSQLQINGYTLTLTTLTGAGTLTGSTTSSLVISGTGGGNFGTINFSSGAGGSLKSFTLNRSGSGGAATIGTALAVYDVLTITSGALNTGGRLTLKSTATGTARVAPVTGTISGNVTVERYIPARRAWRLMNSPVGGNQTVNQAWQEGATTASANPNPAPGYGTYVTVGSVANGFDQNILGLSTSSLKSFTAAGALQVVGNTKTATVANKPYMVFIRGDRSIIMRSNTVPANNTTLRATGPLLTGNQTIPVAASGFTAVANPFASPINFASVTKNNVTNGFYVWDPKMGGTNGVGAYVNVSFNGTGYDVTPASVSPESQYIQSGQSFLVQSTGTAGSLVIKESDKSATTAQNVFRQSADDAGDGLVFAPAKNASGLRINLQAADGSAKGVLDEVFASYSNSFSDEIDNMDALKVTNELENLAIIRKGQSLMVDRRNRIQNADTLKLNLSNTTASTYMFEFSPIELAGAESVTLVDHYLKTETAVSLTEASQVYFQVGGDSRSSATDRFSVIIVNKKGLPGLSLADKAGIRVYPNPVTANGTVNLRFDNIQAGMYRVELVNSSGQTVYSRMMQLNNGTFNQQLNIGRGLPSGVYQMKVTGKDTRTVIKVIMRK